MSFSRRQDLIAVVLLACLAFILATILGLGMLARSGQLPTFYLPLRLDQRHMILVSNGPNCRPELPRSACRGMFVGQVFSVTSWGPDGYRVIMSIRQQ